VPPSTVTHLDLTIVVLRRSPASVEHHHRHHAVVLTKLSLNTRLDRSSRDVIGLIVCWTRRCRVFGTWSVGLRRRSTTSTALLKRFRSRSTRVRGQHSYPLIAMHHLDRSCVVVWFFLKLPLSPTVASEPGLCVDFICTSRTQRVVGDNSHTAYYMSYFDSAVLLDEAAQTDITWPRSWDWFYHRASHTGG